MTIVLPKKTEIMDAEIHNWFDSTFLVLNESYQLDLCRIISSNTHQLIQRLAGFYLYDSTGLFGHLLGLTSHYLTGTSFIYADNQLRHRLNLQLLLIAREGYERSSLVEHIKQAMNNVQSIHQTGKPLDTRHRFNSNVFCQSDDFLPLSNGFCLSDKFDEHGTSTHTHQQQSASIVGTSNGDFIREIFAKRTLNSHTDWLMVFLASQPRLFCRRSKLFDFNQCPSLEHWILMIHCLCSNPMEFYFESTQTNQIMSDYLDTLALKAKSLEHAHPCLASRYLSAREHVLRVSASLHILQMSIETLFIYRQTYHTYVQPDKTFVENSMSILEQGRSTRKISINSMIVQSAIYFVNMSIKQFEIMFEPAFNPRIIFHREYNDSLFRHSPIYDDSRFHRTTSPQPANKRLKTMIDPAYFKSLGIAYELLLLPFVAFTRTSVYGNSKIKRCAIYLDSVIEELKKHRLIISVRQGVQMIDGTRRRVDLLVKCAPVLNGNETYDHNLMERLNQFGVDYEKYIQTLGTLDIGEKYRLTDQCFQLLNSSNYKRYLTIDLERFAPIHRLQEVDDDGWKSSSPSSIKIEPDDACV